MDDKKEKKILEKDIMREVCEYLSEKNVFFWRSNNIPVFAVNNGGERTFRSLPKYTPRGLPDIIAVVRGRLICIEVKRPGAQLRLEQAEFGVRLVSHGGTYVMVRSVQELLFKLPHLLDGKNEECAAGRHDFITINTGEKRCINCQTLPPAEIVPGNF